MYASNEKLIYVYLHRQKIEMLGLSLSVIHEHDEVFITKPPHLLESNDEECCILPGHFALPITGSCQTNVSTV